MSIESKAQALTDIAVNITTSMGRNIMSKAAGDMLAMVKERWIQQGKSSSGNLLTYRSPQYKKWRNEHGYQTGHKDFMVKGTMWKGVKVKAVKVNGSRITISYGPTDSDTQKKVEGHNAREKTNILYPTAEEIQYIRSQVPRYIKEEIKKALRGR